VVIFSSQMVDFFGLRPAGELPADFIGKWKALVAAAPTFDSTAALVGLGTLLILVLWPKVSRRIPGALVALIAASAAVRILGLDVETIGSRFGTLSAALPLPRLPSLDWDTFVTLIPPAFTIAILGSIESLMSAAVSDGMIGSKHRSNTELIGQGVANAASALFGGMPATGAIARTVANVKNGGRTPVAGMVHAAVLLLIVLAFMPLARLIPLASLAAILVLVAYNMSEWREFAELFKSPKSDVAVLVVTFLITVLVDLVTAIEVGVVLAAILFMKRMADVSEVQVLGIDALEDSGPGESAPEPKYRLPRGVLLYEVNGPLFFGAADKFVEAMGELGEHVDVLIVRMRNVPAMDATALRAFRNLVDLCAGHRIRLFVSGVAEQPMGVLRKSGVYDAIGAPCFFGSVDEAIAAAEAAAKPVRHRPAGN
jgi:SulP family sulfate permease